MNECSKNYTDYTLVQLNYRDGSQWNRKEILSGASGVFKKIIRSLRIYDNNVALMDVFSIEDKNAAFKKKQLVRLTETSLASENLEFCFFEDGLHIIEMNGDYILSYIKKC